MSTAARRRDEAGDEVLAWALAERERRRLAPSRKFSQYKDDPCGFVDQALLGFLWSKQKEIALAVRDHRLVVVPSCHDVGKTALAARIAAWWVAPWDPGEAFVVSMAPTAPQVKALLWRELNRVHAIGQLPGRMNLTEWYINNEMVAFGRSPADDDPTAIQGIHAARVLVIGDEACGLSKELLDAASSLCANDNSRMLLIGNPDDPATEFANLAKPGSGAKVIPISVFDSPNFTGEAVPEWLKPLLVSRTWVAERARLWGLESPLYISKVLGQFPEQSSDGLVPLAALNAAKARGAAFEAMPEGIGGDLGVDVARFGDDHTVIYHRRGPLYERIAKDHNRDLMHVTGMVIEAVRSTKARRVKIDDAGLGGGVTDRLREIQNGQGQGDAGAKSALMGVEIVPINVGEGAKTNQADERFRNLRAELNWQTRMGFVDNKITLIGADPHNDMLSQAAQIKYKLTSTGEIQIEAKADMKKRTKGVSPDDWDALVLAGAEPSFSGAGILEYYRRESEALTANAAKRNAPVVAPTTETGGVRLRVAGDVSTVYGMSGRVYQVQGGEIIADPNDAKPLLGQGFERIE